MLDADIWGFSIPRMLGVQRPARGHEAADDGKGKIVPHEVDGPAAGTLKVVSMGLLVDDEDTALMWRGLILAKALEQFLIDVQWGDLDYLLIDMPPGTGDIQMALVAAAAAGRDARRHHAGARARRRSRRASPTWRAARTSRCSASSRTCTSSSRPTAAATRSSDAGGGRRLAEAHRRAARRRGADRARGVRRRRRTASPVVLEAPDYRAAVAFTDDRRRIVDELLPPVEMAGCTARIFELAKNARTA